MKVTVQAGVMQDVSNMFKKFTDLLFNGLDKLISSGLKITEDKEESGEDGSKLYHIVTGKNHKMDLRVTPLDSALNRVDLEFIERSGKKYHKKNVKVKDDLADAISLAAQDLFGETLESSVASSVQLCATFQRVSAAEDCSINLVAVNAACSPITALSILDEIAQDDEFISQISEEPMSFAICDEGNEYDVSLINTVCTDATYETVLSVALNALADMQTVHWNIKGEGFTDLHEFTQTCIYTMYTEIDALAELCVETCGCVKSPKALMNCSECASAQSIPFATGVATLTDVINNYIATLELYSCNMSPDVQSLVNSWIREWHHLVDYKLKQMTV